MLADRPELVLITRIAKEVDSGKEPERTPDRASAQSAVSLSALRTFINALSRKHFVFQINTMT